MKIATYIDAYAGTDSYSTVRADRIVGLIPVICLLVLVYLKLEQPLVYQNYFMKEDGPVEYLTSVVFILASITAGSIAITLYRQTDTFLSILYSMLSFGLFVIGMEEISWGQRLLGIATPEVLKEFNHQDEITLHNMLRGGYLHSLFIVVGLYGSFSRVLVPQSLKLQYAHALDLLTPRYSQVLYFLPTLLLYLFYELSPKYLSRYLGEDFKFSFGFKSTSEIGDGFMYFIHARDQEPIELLLAAGFLVFVVNNLKYCRDPQGHASKTSL